MGKKKVDITYYRVYKIFEESYKCATGNCYCDLTFTMKDLRHMSMYEAFKKLGKKINKSFNKGHISSYFMQFVGIFNEHPEFRKSVNYSIDNDNVITAIIALEYLKTVYNNDFVDDYIDEMIHIVYEEKGV